MIMITKLQKCKLINVSIVIKKTDLATIQL